MIREQNTSDEEKRDDSFLQKLADMSPALLYLFDVLEWRCIYINARSLDLLGYPPETILAMGADFMLQTLHPDDRTKISEHFERLQAASDGTYSEIEYRMRHINGSWRWFSSRDTVFKRTSEGKICQISGTAEDITDRKRTEEALRESERRFQAFMNNSPTSAWMVDENGKIIYLNSTYFRMFQLTQPDAIGKNVLEIYPEEFAKQFIENNQQVLQSDRLLETIENAPRSDGRIGDFLVYKFPIKNSLNEAFVGGVGIDITAHRQSEKALIESEQRFRKMFEEAPIGISAIDLNHKFIQANKTYCEMLGYTERELCQMTFTEITHPEDMNAEKDYVRQILKGEITSYQIEKRYITKSAQIIWVNLTATTIFDLQGQPLYCFAMAENITIRKREEQRKATRYELTRVLVEAKTLVEAIPRILQSLCESLGWKLGIIWSVDASENVLRYVDSWHSTTVNLEEFIQLNQLTTFTIGVGLPGRVWASGNSCWLENLSDDSNFPRAASAARAGLGTALAFPIQIGNEIFGAIECFSDRVQLPDPDLLQMVQLIGSQIGQFIQQKKTEEALRESQALFESFMKHSPIAAFIKDETGRYIYANSWIEQVYQRQQSDLIGKTDFELLPFEVAQQFRTNDIRVLTSSQPLQILEKIHHQDGEHYYMSFKFPFRNTSGSQLLAGVAIDVSDRVRAEETLRQREQELASIADAVPVLISYVDSQQRYRFNNRSYEQWFGLSKTELYGKYLWEIMGESAYEKIRPYVEQALSGQSITFETQIYYQNVGLRYGSVSYIPQFDSQQKVKGFVALVNDLTDRVLAQEALRQSDERFRLAARAVSGVIYDWDMKIGTVYRSEGLYQLIGVRPEEIPQHRDWWLERVHPDDRFQIREMMLSMLASNSDRYASEYRIYHEDGRWIDVWDRGYLIRDPDGEITRVVGWTADITERKQSEAEKLQLLEQIKTERELLEAVLQQMPAGVMVAEAPSGKILLSNERIKEIWRIPALLPIDRIDRQGQGYQGFHLDGRPYQAHEWPLARSVRMGEIVIEEEIAFLRGDGTRGIMLVNSAPIRDSQGNIKAGVVTFFDISDRKQAEKEKEHLLERERTAREEAEAANRIKDEFLAVLSHELRSPLNPILGWTSLLRKRQLDEQTTSRALETIERNAKLQTQLIEDLLDVSRILRGKMALNVAPVNLADTIEAALETVQLAAQAKNIQIRTFLGDRSERVSGDSARLQQVVWNLLSNAVKFTPAEGTVEVSLIPDKSQAKIIVSDTGKGIGQDFLPYVFDYFRQEDGKITRKFGGLGLGLAIVRHITELHGGTVRAESPGDGMGAIFTVILPLLPSESAKIEGEKRDSSGTSDRAFPLFGWRILVVDDEPDVRDLLEVVLKQAGAEVIVAKSAIEALNIFDRDRPDILISDIGMPEMDGYMLMQKVRNMPPEKCSQIPAIALTAYAGEFDRQQAIGAGFQQHISKPVEPQELIRAIVNLRKYEEIE